MLDIEEEFARSETLIMADIENFAFVMAGEGIPEEVHHLMMTVFGMGIMMGIRSAYRSVLEDTPIKYTGLIPDSPEDLL